MIKKKRDAKDRDKFTTVWPKAIKNESVGGQTAD